MKRNKVKSSTLLSAGYDADHETLELEFTSGEVYRYFKVPYMHFAGLMEAASHGEYFNKFIKDKYLFVKSPSVI